MQLTFDSDNFVRLVSDNAHAKSDKVAGKAMQNDNSQSKLKHEAAIISHSECCAPIKAKVLIAFYGCLFYKAIKCQQKANSKCLVSIKSGKRVQC